MRNPRLLITAIALLLLGLVANHFLQRPPAPQFAPDLQGTPTARAPAPASTSGASGLPAFLPAEARATIALIQRGGPFPHRQDGSTFGNREQQLPGHAATTANTPSTPPAHAPAARAASSPAAIRRKRGTTPTTITRHSAASPYRPRERSDEP